MSELKATDIAMCYYQSNIGGSLIETKSWTTGGYYYAGCHAGYAHNYVLVIRFTTEKRARNVKLPLTCSLKNGTSADVKLCYALGNDPAQDSSLTNITGSEKAAGTFHFDSVDSTITITLGTAKKGTNYLYIWGLDPTHDSLTTFNVASTVSSGITYEELKGGVYFKDGDEFSLYETHIYNGTDWDLHIPHIYDSTSWSTCG